MRLKRSGIGNTLFKGGDRSAAVFAVMAAVVMIGGLTAPAQAATTFDGITFPEGDISFADEVVSFNPEFTSSGSLPPVTDPTLALGPPDRDVVGSDDFVQLNSGGRITLKFVDNVLTGSGDDSPDLHIFEVGGLAEDTFVSISKDGSTFFDVGEVGGGTSSIDIDAFGFGTSDEFRFVRLLDDTSEGNSSGAEINAVGAISTAPAAIPTPTAAMGGLVLLGSMAMRRRRRSTALKS